jgi:hypothetical protein
MPAVLYAQCCSSVICYNAVGSIAEGIFWCYAGPLSLLATIVSGFVVGISFLLSVTFSIQDPAMVLSPGERCKPLQALIGATVAENYGLQRVPPQYVG